MIPSRPAPTGVRALALVVLALVALAGCGGEGASSAAPSDSPGTSSPPAGPADPSPTADPGSSKGPGPTEDPGASATTAPTPTPTPAPTTRPSGTASPAAACTGSAENRAFYASVAEDVAWDVYCPVLPAGWFVDAGTFRLAAGGRLEIDYKGPAGARLEIRQGAYCRGDDDCIPSGPDAGPASFGGRPARLFDAGDGRWLVVAEGGDVSWEVLSSGLSREAALTFAADFTRVGR